MRLLVRALAVAGVFLGSGAAWAAGGAADLARATVRAASAPSLDPRALVDEVVAAAPPALRVRVTTAWEPAGGADPGDPPPADPHRIVAVHGRTLRVYVPAEPTPAWEAAARRAVLHALVHVADRHEGWSASARWRGISGWGPLGGGPAERDPAAFVSPAAPADAAEDLAATVTALDDAAVAPPPVDVDPRCRLAAKARFVATVIGGVAPRDCPTLGQLGLGDVASVELAYATGSVASVASIAGHVLVVLRYTPDAAGVERREAWSMVAATQEVGPSRQIVAGLVGGLPSMLVHEPFERVVQGYARGDDRDVRRYRLLLSPDEQARLLARLDELRQGWDRPYLFFTRNCTALPVALLSAAFEHATSTAARDAPIRDPADVGPGLPRLPAPLAPEALLGALARAGRLEEVPVERVDELAVRSRALAADRLRAAEARSVATARPELAPAVHAVVRRGNAAERAAAYTALAAAADDDLPTLQAFDRILGWSDMVEQVDVEQVDVEQVDPDAATVEALRAAKAAVRRRALALGAPLASLGGTDAAILDALARPRGDLGAHGPLHIVTVAAEAAPGLEIVSLGRALYATAIGEPRRFSAGATTAYTVLSTEVSLASTGEVGLAGRVLDVRRLLPTRGPVAEGGYVRLGEYDTRRAAVRWLDAGGMLGLWRGREGGAYGWVSGGVAVDTRVGAPGDAATLAAVGVLAPVGLHARVGSARQVLTAATLTAEWAPRVDLAGGFGQSGEARLELGSRLGEIRGADVGLVLSGAARGEWGAAAGLVVGGAWGVSPSVGVGVRLERF